MSNLTYQESRINRVDRHNLFNPKVNSGCTLWFTGLSSSGKTTISFKLEEYLIKEFNILCYCLDGDNIRTGLNSNLGFSQEDRDENIRRIGEVAKLFADSGLLCLASFISPYEKERQRARTTHLKSNLDFIEIYINTPLNVCEKRDVKGLYKKARQGLLKNFTGIDSNYEVPQNPDLVIDTCLFNEDECVQQIVEFLKKRGIVKVINDKVPKELFITEPNELDRLKELSKNLYNLNINRIEAEWVQVLSEGWASPLNGFMNEDQYLQCLHFNCIKIDDQKVNQSIPIVLSCHSKDRQALIESKANSLNLVFNDKLLAILENISIFDHRKEERCARQFGIVNQDHPHIRYIFNECGDYLIGGSLRVFERIRWNDGLDEYRLTPAELRIKYQEYNADVVFAFQLRNPIHNGHALLMKDTREYLLTKGYKNPVLLLHPLGGWTKDDDVPLDVRIEQHKAVLESNTYLNSKSTILAIFPSPMCYAGPTEVQWHAKARLNASCEYYIVGRDPAGMPHPQHKNDLYDPTHGARVLQMAPGLDKLKILPFKVAAYNKLTQKMDYFNPQQSQDYEFISGTKMRTLARTGQLPPNGFMIDKAWSILASYYKNLGN